MYVLGQTLTPDENSSFRGSYYFLEMNGLNVRQGERGNMKQPSFLLEAK